MEAYGGTKDSVLVRSDGRPTYLLVDIAYHVNKRDRGFERVIDVQGADYQTEESSMKAAMRVLGFPEEFLTYGQHQFVSIKEGEKTARMSTRAGRFILLPDLLDELGRDVVRYFLVARTPRAAGRQRGPAFVRRGLSFGAGPPLGSSVAERPGTGGDWEGACGGGCARCGSGFAML